MPTHHRWSCDDRLGLHVWPRPTPLSTRFRYLFFSLLIVLALVAVADIDRPF
jgi:hypothetical protein